MKEIKIINKLLLLFYGFYIIYLPDFGFISSFFNPSFLLMILMIFNIIVLNRKLIWFFRKFKLYPVAIILLVFAIYILILNVYKVSGGLNIYNITPYFIYIIQIFNYLALVIWFFKLNKNADNKKYRDFIILLGIIQAIISFSMVLIPMFRDFAVLLYSQSGEIAQGYGYLLNNRIYGIGSSYTFMLPLIQGIISILSLNQFYKTNKTKYMFISIFIILSSLLNSRTAFLIYLILFVIYFIRYNSKYFTIKNMILIFGVFVIIIASINILLRYFPATEEWLSDGYKQIYLFIFEGEKTGGIEALFGDFLVFPEGKELFLGTGQMVFGESGRQTFGFDSDIGYIIDLFMGGIFYSIILYGTITYYYSKNIDNKFLVVMSLMFIFMANYKGDVMLGTPIIMILFSISFSDQYNGNH